MRSIIGYDPLSQIHMIDAPHTPNAATGPVPAGMQPSQPGHACPGVPFLMGSETLHIVSILDSFIGTPFLWNGESRSGADCGGLAVAVLRALYGPQVPGRPAPVIPSRPDLYAPVVERWLRDHFIPVPPEALMPADVLHFRLSRGPHISVYYPADRHLNNIMGAPARLSPLRPWLRYLTGAFRFKGAN
jgi:cell wall-associated NlpC family hydrolase